MIPTEKAAQRYANLEAWPTREIVESMFEGQIAAVSACHAATGTMAEAVDRAVDRLESGGRLIYLGAGTSGRIGAVDAAELPPTFGWPPERAIALMAGGLDAFATAVEGAEDDGAAAVSGLEVLGVGAADVVIGLAASGRTPYVVEGLRHARTAGALTVAIGNAPGAPIGAVADFYLIADTGPEIIAGSTRMKAGTAQKAMLTSFSSAMFVRMGFVFRGRMVDMRPSNQKLQRRAIDMVAELTDTPPDKAERALTETEGSIKIAVVMLSCGVSRREAEARLDKARGRLHVALSG